MLLTLLILKNHYFRYIFLRKYVQNYNYYFRTMDRCEQIFSVMKLIKNKNEIEIE